MSDISNIFKERPKGRKFAGKTKARTVEKLRIAMGRVQDNPNAGYNSILGVLKDEDQALAITEYVMEFGPMYIDCDNFDDNGLIFSENIKYRTFDYS